MSASLVEQVCAVRVALSDLDAGLLSADTCASLVGELTLLSKACDAARGRLAVRVQDCGAHHRRGFAEAGDWLAGEAGISTTAANHELATARALEACPATRRAFAGGELSLPQAAEVAKTEAACPGSESDLLDTARTRPLRVLREQARKRRLSAIEPEDLAARQHAARRFRHWRDDLGMLRYAGALTPLAGAAFLARLDAETERIRRAARKQGPKETWEAYAADALVRLTQGDGTRKSSRPEVVFVCDINAFRRGVAAPGEACHVVGGGPVPVSTVRAHLDVDPFVKAVLHDGVKVQVVKHFRRHIPAEMRTALELGPPPDFDGKRCGCGCGKRYKLQFDHVDPLAHNGPTSMANLNPRTPVEHAEKTRQDRRAGLLTGVGSGPVGGGPVGGGRVGGGRRPPP